MDDRLEGKICIAIQHQKDNKNMKIKLGTTHISCGQTLDLYICLYLPSKRYQLASKTSQNTQ